MLCKPVFFWFFFVSNKSGRYFLVRVKLYFCQFMWYFFYISCWKWLIWDFSGKSPSSKQANKVFLFFIEILSDLLSLRYNWKQHFSLNLYLTYLAAKYVCHTSATCLVSATKAAMREEVVSVFHPPQPTRAAICSSSWPLFFSWLSLSLLFHWGPTVALQDGWQLLATHVNMLCK